MVVGKTLCTQSLTNPVDKTENRRHTLKKQIIHTCNANAQQITTNTTIKAMTTIFLCIIHDALVSDNWTNNRWSSQTDNLLPFDFLSLDGAKKDPNSKLAPLGRGIGCQFSAQSRQRLMHVFVQISFEKRIKIKMDKILIIWKYCDSNWFVEK